MLDAAGFPVSSSSAIVRNDLTSDLPCDLERANARDRLPNFLPACKTKADNTESAAPPRAPAPMKLSSEISCVLSVEEVDRFRSNRGPVPVQKKRPQSPLERFLRAVHPGPEPHLAVAERVRCPVGTAKKWLLSQNSAGRKWAFALECAYGPAIRAALNPAEVLTTEVLS